MVHKDEMCALFKTLRSVDRIEILCGMFQLCVPQELRFIGSCLEDLIQKNYKLLYDAECVANDSKQLKGIAKPFNKIDKDFCASLNTISVYLSLLHSDNTSCAISMFSILNDLKTFFESQLTQSDTITTERSMLNNEFIEDVMLIFTMASYHPAFTITQRLRMYEICKSMKELLKKNAFTNDVDHNQTFSENFITAQENQSFPVSIIIKKLHVNPLEKSDEVELDVSWSSRALTSCFKYIDEIQQLHYELVQSFPELPELQSMSSYLSLALSSSCSLAERENLSKYFQKLTSLPKYVLKCRTMQNFLCHFGNVGSIPSTDFMEHGDVLPNDGNNSSNNNNSSSTDDPEFCCDGRTFFPAEEGSPPLVSHDLKKSRKNSGCESSSTARLLPSRSICCPASPSSRCKTSTSHSNQNHLNINNSSVAKSHSHSKWSNTSEMKAKSASSLADERLPVQHSQYHRQHYYHEKQHLQAVEEPVMNGSEAMKDCEEISSQLFMTKLLTISPTEGGNHLHNSHAESHQNYCGAIHGGGDNVVKSGSNCSKSRNTETSSNVSKNKCDKNLSEDQNPTGMPPSLISQSATVEPNLGTTFVASTTLSGKVLRPILGASVNQNKLASDDMRIPSVDLKSSSSASVSALPRASSCGVIVQRDQDFQSLTSADDSRMHPNFSALHIPSNIAFNLDAFYNNMDSQINFIHLPFPSFNHQGEAAFSQGLPVPPIPLSAIPPPHINASLLPPLTSSLSLNQPCTCCSSPLPQFSGYPLWPPHIIFPNNGLIGPRFPHNNIRQCPSSVYMQTPFDYVPYNSPGVMITSPSSIAIPSVPSTAAPVLSVPRPQVLPSAIKRHCHNCGSSSHTVDLCNEPFMLSVGQSAQFKLKTVPKESSDS